VAKSDKTSPAAAGFEAVTSVKSVECVIAGPVAVTTTSGVVIGMTCRMTRFGLPPLLRRFAGFSMIDAERGVLPVPSA
jgi:hypothetical protein